MHLNFGYKLCNYFQLRIIKTKINLLSLADLQFVFHIIHNLYITILNPNNNKKKYAPVLQN